MLNTDTETMTGTCQKCGPVELGRKRGGVRCKNALKEQKGPGKIETRREYSRNRPGRWGHGLSINEAKTLRENKNCEICGGPAETVDHCHTTNNLRGVLCRSCNFGLGHFKDSPERLEAAADYIRRHTAP
jgi:hypothetical protein